MGYSLWSLKESDMTEQLRTMGPGGPRLSAWEAKAPLLPSQAPGLGQLAGDLVLVPCQWGLQPLGPGQVGRCRLAFHQGHFPLMFLGRQLPRRQWRRKNLCTSASLGHTSTMGRPLEITR